jgi:cytochrome c-type biogenesis protein CcmE
MTTQPPHDRASPTVRRNRWLAVGAVVVALSALGFVSMGDLGENLVYYWSPTELAAADSPHDAVVRLGGMVVAGSYTWDRESHTVTFDVTDMQNTVHVVNQGNPPEMFREGIGVVVEGRLGSDGVFRSDKVMVKHDNEYQAPKAGEHPADIYKNIPQTLEDGK